MQPVKVRDLVQRLVGFGPHHDLVALVGRALGRIEHHAHARVRLVLEGRVLGLCMLQVAPERELLHG